MILVYLISLFIAPQLWIEPFVGLRVDLIIYPVWIILIIVASRTNDLLFLNAQDKIFIGMIFWIIVTSIVNVENALTGTVMFNYIKWFILYKLIAITLSKDDGLKSVIKSSIFIVYIIVFEAIQHKFSPDGIGWAGQGLGWVDQSVLDAGGTGRTRWINIFDGPGVFCVMFTFILPFLLQYLDKHYSLTVKFISLTLLGPLLFAIWTTGSRGGFLATLAIIGAYILSRMNISFLTMVKIGGLLIAVYVAAPSHLTQVKDDNNSAQHRVDMWMEGIEMVELNPLFGIGKGNFASYTGTLIAHNSSIEVMGELGVPGFFMWIALLYLSFKNIRLYIDSEDNPVRASYAKGVSLSLIGYLVSSFFITLEYETLYFILAITRSMVYYKNIEVEFNRKDFYIVTGLMLGFYLVLKVFVKMYF